MAHSILSPNVAFGFNSQISHGACFLDESRIIYPVGHSIIVHHLESKSQRFITAHPATDTITALAVTHNKSHLAISERGRQTQVSVYDLNTFRRKKTITFDTSLPGEVTSLNFSHDGKLLAAQTGKSDWILSIWDWEKAKIVATVKTSTDGHAIHQVLFGGSNNSSSVYVIGQDVFKMFRLNDTSLKQQPHLLNKQDEYRFLCLDCSTEEILVGCDKGDILCMEKSEIIWRHRLDSTSAESIARTPAGFVIGCGDGTIFTFDKDSTEFYSPSKSVNVGSGAIDHLVVSPTGENFLATTTTGQIFLQAVANLDLAPEFRESDLAFVSFHEGEILGLSTCTRKQLIASSSADKTIRLWNYSNRMTELIQKFPEECFSLSLHPSGTSIVAGFSDKLRMMTILIDDFKIVKEFAIRSCKECKFSNGGHCFAAASGNTIIVYSTYTCDTIAALRGHSGRVSSICWSSDDLSLISAGSDGAVYDWNLKEQKRQRESVLKGCSYSSVASTLSSDSIFAVGSDMKLKEMEDLQAGGTQITKEIPSDDILTQLAMPPNEKGLFVATQKGTIRVYAYPLTGEYEELKLVREEITRLAFTANGTVLVAGGKEGAVLVFNVREPDLASQLRREQLMLPWAEEVLVSKTEVDEKHQRMQELEMKVNEITMQTEYQLRLKDLHLQEKLKDQADRHEEDLLAERKRHEMLNQEKNEMELDYEEQLRIQQERSEQQMNALDSQYQQKILAEVERYHQLVQERDAMNKRWDEQNTLLVESHEATIQQLTEEYEMRLHEEKVCSETLRSEKERLEDEFEEVRRQLEEDADCEIDDLKRRYEKKLVEEREIGLRLKGQNGIMRKKFSVLQGDIEAQKEEIKALFDQKAELCDTVSSLEKDISSTISVDLKKAVSDRDENINDKERRIYDLKKKNQELEKFKFVLDYKIKELKSLIEPKEEEIEQYKSQVAQMDIELQQYNATNSTLNLAISNLKLRQSGLVQQIDAERSQKEKSRRRLESILRDLEDLVQHIQHPKLLRDKAAEMYRRHDLHPASDGHDFRQSSSEFDKQRNYLEKTVESLRVKSQQEAKQSRLSTIKSMQENSELIKEINSLRKRLGQPHQDPLSESALQSQLSSKQETIDQLQLEIKQKEERILQLERSVVSRPVSRERLTPTL